MRLNFLMVKSKRKEMNKTIIIAGNIKIIDIFVETTRRE